MIDFDSWCAALKNSTFNEYKLYLAVQLPKKQRKQKIKNMFYAAKQMGLSKRKAYEIISGMLCVHYNTVRYHLKK